MARKIFDDATIKRATDAVLAGGSGRAVADSLGIPLETLCRCVQFQKEVINPKSANTRFTGRLVFTVREEDVFTEYLIDASNVGFPVDGKTLRNLAN